ncbi:translation initiation factor IF-2-like [Cervus canadensis]|uniref:translation initiation factor IF-2-like n=1 Tax=Cervus canadensis TaxID=1574408 RepID=UPI001CA36326|nr:translation initiation factor IF-2-like [Cervus canadensis]
MVAASRLGPVPEGRPGPRGAGAAAAGPGSVLATLRAALPPAPASRGVRAAPHRKPDIRAPATAAREVRRGRGRTAPRSAARGARGGRAQTPREARALRRPRGPRAPASPSPRRGEPGGRAARAAAAAAPGGEAGERGAARRRRRRAQGQGMADAPSACAYVRESGRGRARAEPGRPPRAPALAASLGARAAPPPPPAARVPPRGGRGPRPAGGLRGAGLLGRGRPGSGPSPPQTGPGPPARGSGELQILEVILNFDCTWNTRSFQNHT